MNFHLKLSSLIEFHWEKNMKGIRFPDEWSRLAIECNKSTQVGWINSRIYLKFHESAHITKTIRMALNWSIIFNTKFIYESQMDCRKSLTVGLHVWSVFQRGENYEFFAEMRGSPVSFLETYTSQPNKSPNGIMPESMVAIEWFDYDAVDVRLLADESRDAD